MPSRVAWLAPLVASGVVAIGAAAWVRTHTTPVKALSIPRGTPVVNIVEGQAGSAYPYSPAVVHLRAGRLVAIRITDNLGGCGLATVFPGLAPKGGIAQVVVPVGATKVVLIRAPRPGTFVFHCASDMYFGRIVASA